jgi:hypothetical protein
MEAEATQPAPEQPQQDVTNPDLVAAIQQLADDNEANRKQFYRALVGAKFLLALAEPVDGILDGEVPRKTGMEVGFAAVRDDMGTVTVPAFTDKSALKRWRPEGCPWMVLPATLLLPTMVKGGAGHLDINPAGPNSIRVTSAEIDSLVHGQFPQPPTSVEAVLGVVHSPTAKIAQLELSAEIESVLRNAFSIRREIIDAYAFSVTDGAVQRQVIGLRFSDKPARAIMNAWVDQLTQLVHPVRQPGQTLDFVHVNDREVLARVSETVQPFFYRR